MKQKITMKVVEKFVAKHPDGVNHKDAGGRYTYFNQGADKVNGTITKFDDPQEVRPGCLFGHIIASLGGGPELVVEGQNISSHDDVLSTRLKPLEVRVLDIAQSKADDNVSWAEALRIAKERVWG